MLEDKPAELSILTKTEDMAEYSYKALAQFPKSEKFALVVEIKNCINAIIGLEITAKKKYYKKTTLQDLDVELAKLRYFVRLSMKLGFLPIKKYEVWGDMLVELGKMIGGWIRSINSAGGKPAKND